MRRLASKRFGVNEPGSPLDYFIGGVPPYPLFQLNFDELSELVATSKAQAGSLDTRAEVCLIGLAAYFEAFCKNQFAALANICPETLRGFCKRRENSIVKVKDILQMLDGISYRIGSLLAEQYDFGSAKSINGLYQDLLRVTPFSREDAAKYARLLNDRNLLVHHGGIYTFRYHGQKFIKQYTRGRKQVHFNSLVLGRDDFVASATWVDGMAKKMATASHKALGEFMKGKRILLTSIQREAFISLRWGVGNQADSP